MSVMSSALPHGQCNRSRTTPRRIGLPQREAAAPQPLGMAPGIQYTGGSPVQTKVKVKIMRMVSLRPTALILLVAASVSASAETPVPGPAVGDFFPLSIAAEDQAGERRTLGELAGDAGLVLAFVRSADWCPFCKAQLADLDRRAPEFERLGLAVVSVSVDEVAEIAAFGKAQDIGYTMLADPGGDINEDLGIRDEQYPVGSAAFGVPRPVLYIIDTNATVRAVYMEPTHRTRPDLDRVLREAAALELQ